MTEKRIFDPVEYLEEYKKQKQIKLNRKRNIRFRKGSIISVIAAVLSATIGLTMFGCSRKKTKTADVTDEMTNSIQAGKIGLTSIDSLGVLKNIDTTTKNEYGKTTGNVDKNKIVSGSNGKLYKDQTALNNSSKVGKTSVDTKNGTIEKRNDGDYYQKDKEYEIKDENGNVVDTGKVNENNLPDGYIKDQESGKIFEEDGKSKWVAPDGSVWESEERYNQYLESLKNDGEKVDVEIIEDEENENTTSETLTNSENTNTNSTLEPQTNTDSKEEVEEKLDEGVVNANGTYTVNGVTYKSKDDFYQFCMDPSGYMRDPDDGVIKPKEDVFGKINSYQKVISLYHEG